MADVYGMFSRLLGGGDPEAEAAAQASTAMQPAVLDMLQDRLRGLQNTYADTRRLGGTVGDYLAQAPGAAIDYAGNEVARPFLQQQEALINRDWSKEPLIGTGESGELTGRLPALASMVTPYLAGGAPGGSLSSGIRRTASRPEMVYRDIDLSKLPANPEDFRGFLRGAAWYEPQRNVITGTHVTDNPNVVIDTLRRGDLLTARGDKYGDLGRGLYFSDTPEMWMSRSRDKWEFLDRLTLKERQGLATSLQAEIDRMPQGYISQGERESALRGLDRFASGEGPPHAALNFAEQPYNIDFSSPEFLSRLGIAPSPQPQKVPIEVAGRFADLKRNISEAEAQQLRDLGYSGAFTRNSMGTTAQSVVYDPIAVQRFGDWFR